MKILVFSKATGGPCAVATLPKEYYDTPDWLELPGTPSAGAQMLHSKGPMLSWLDWAQHLVAQTSPYGGRWSLEDVPDAWKNRPDLLRKALAQAQAKTSLA